MRARTRYGFEYVRAPTLEDLNVVIAERVRDLQDKSCTIENVEWIKADDFWAIAQIRYVEPYSAEDMLTAFGIDSERGLDKRELV